MERDKIVNEYKETIKLISELRKILGDEKLIFDIIVKELEEIRDKYGDKRKTEIKGQLEELSDEDLIAEEEMVVTVTHAGYVKRNPLTLYRSQKRGGKGKTSI